MSRQEGFTSEQRYAIISELKEHPPTPNESIDSICLRLGNALRPNLMIPPPLTHDQAFVAMRAAGKFDA